MLSTAMIQRRAPVKEPKVRMRKCAVQSCRTPFAPRNMMHKCCSPDCALAFAVAERERHLKLERRAGLEKLKRKADYVAEAQRYFNAFIRARDEGLPCICCGKTGGAYSRGGVWDAGHYRSRGSAPHLRFDESNCHAQLKVCNRYGAGRAVDYRLGLIARIGLAAVEALETDDTPRHWSIDELKAIAVTYRAKLAQLKKERT